MMQVRVLGSAAGGGSPQWNCRCDVCDQVRAGAPGTRPRTQSSIAVRTGEGERWLLVNASPDVHRQLPLLGDDTVRSDDVRHSPVGAVLLTDAEIDHCAGLLLLRESTEPLVVFGTEQARGALTHEYPVVSMLDDWCGVEWNGLVADSTDAADVVRWGALEIEAFTTGEDAPRYQRTPGGPGTSIGVTMRDTASGQVLTYCPTLESWSDDIAARMAASDVVLVDGTFWRDDELVRTGAPGARTARQMGHMPLGGADGSAVRLAALDTRVVLVHLNNSNPVLVEGSAERARLDELDIAVGFDGMDVMPA